MRIPLTRYGLPQVIIYPLGIVAAMIVYLVIALRSFPDWAIGTPWAILTLWGVEVALLAVLAWSLSFFRDPRREIPRDEKLLLAPADGTVRDIETVDEQQFIGGPALRIGIFLSVFNVHINRSPCDAKIERITYHRGRFVNAMNPLAGKVNESNDVFMVRTNGLRTPDARLETRPSPASPIHNGERLIVRQVSGAIARRIVCAASEGQQLAAGERLGMIKFGSRTELYVPASEDIQCAVRIGDKVKAGVSPLVRYVLRGHHDAKVQA
jgi:phosphatidylserine decarboxylase